MLCFAMLFTGIYLPIRVAFANNISLGWFITECIVDVIFFFDIFVNFLSAFYTDEHVLVVNKREIAKRYLRGWFLIDIAALYHYIYIYISINIYIYIYIYR